MELIDLVNLVITSCWLTFLLGSLAVTLTALILWIYFSSDTSISFPPFGNSDHAIVSVYIDFLWNSQQDALFHQNLMTILVLIGTVFVIIWEMFHGRISLKTVLLLLLVNFVSGFRLELIYLSLMVSIKSSLTHLHGFQLLVWLP